MLYTRSLRKNREFRVVYAQGRQSANRLLALYTKPNHTPENRLGVTVGKKVGKSVVRSRIKRLIRENYRLLEFRISPGYDLVFVARAAAGALNRRDSFREIGRSMTFLLEKQHLLKTGNGEL